LRGWSWPGPLEGQEPRASSRCTALVRLSSTWLTRERFSRVSVVREVTPRATTSSTPSSSTSRTRRGRRSSARPLTALLLLTKDVPHTALGVDQWRAVRGEGSIDLPAQVGDVGLDDRAVPTPVIGPHVVQDLSLAEHTAGVEHQVTQQGELGGGELDLRAGPAHLVRVLVQFQIAHAQHRFLACIGRRLCTAKDGTR